MTEGHGVGPEARGAAAATAAATAARALLRRLTVGALAVTLLAGGLAAGLWAASAVRTVPEDTTPPVRTQPPPPPDPAADKRAAEDSARLREHIVGVHERGHGRGTVIATDLAGTEADDRAAQQISDDYLQRQIQRCRKVKDITPVTVTGKHGDRLGERTQHLVVTVGRSGCDR